MISIDIYVDLQKFIASDIGSYYGLRDNEIAYST